MADLHGAKVASFLVEGQELICLPQVFNLFLKHLVGGLHTVYTKLKRLDIAPIVCNVELVRILRGPSSPRSTVASSSTGRTLKLFTTTAPMPGTLFLIDGINLCLRILKMQCRA
ncbi:hypothetical protein NDU88_002280 [Pleurodeles waltl]|uniref:SKI/SNO/DAC domain-containing protein n=1 Tax=Pleurodeles waltl TaxID=8319 RepID=A0AAV7KSF1_PLEWA|nr:hypothetical protein NDU88_002280 [Pleurodeles waltl]